MTSKKIFLKKLHSGKPLVSDGAWGTQLISAGLRAGECPEKWNLEYPGRISQVAKDYVDAGADLIETNSFGGSSLKLAHYDLAKESYDINARAAEISREAAGNTVWVMGSIGPTGKMLVTGEIEQEVMYQSFLEQATALAAGGADILLVETMTDLDEASIAVQACLESGALPVICTMSFEKMQDGSYKTMMGISPGDMVDRFRDTGISALGSNCGKGTDELLEIARKLRSLAPDLPLLIQANAGIPEYKEDQLKYPDKPKDWKPYIEQLITLRINIIGGCCGTDPSFIRLIRKLVDNK